MRIGIDITGAPQGPWQVEIQVPGQQTLRHGVIGHPVSTRTVLLRDDPGASNPAPDQLARILDEVEADDYKPEDVKLLAGHAFDCLLGAAAWERIAAAGAGLVELAIRCPLDAPAIMRMPWEMVRAAHGYLAGADQPRVAVTRLVEPVRPAGGPAAAEPVPLRIEPTVLFVVGSTLEDPSVRAGAEYLGIMRRLRERGLPVCQHVMIAATQSAVKEAVARLRPAVVHFIGHGGIDRSDGTGFVSFEPEDDARVDHLRQFRRPKVKVKAEPLVAMLTTADGYRPSVLVLAACETAAGGEARWAFAPPLAAECVRRGIPVVVGMGGEVADAACRLFTRRFYEALLHGQCVITAITEGRRAGFELTGDPETSIDWAYPALFLAAHINTTVELVGADCLRTRDQVARDFTHLGFCGRLEFFGHLRTVLRPDGNGPRVLAIRGANPAAAWSADLGVQPSGPPAQYGKTWLLGELAAQALYEGHLPCLVRFDRDQDRPSDEFELAGRILTRVLGLLTDFQLPGPVTQISMIHTGRQNELHHSLRRLLALPGTNSRAPDFVAQALRLDLVTIGEAWHENHDGRIVVLLDDVHKLGPVAVPLLEQFIRGDGLGLPGRPVPVVLTYTDGDPIYETALNKVRTFVEQGPRTVIPTHLGPFLGPVAHHLAYRQHLLGLAKPLVVAPGRDARAQAGDVFDAIHTAVRRGIPSYLRSDRYQSVIELAEKWNVLVAARDDEILEQMSGGGRL